MDELLRLLRNVREALASLLGISQELLALLDEEEKLISEYNLAALDKIVIEKDALVQRAQLIEQRRQAHMMRICFLMSYDARSKTPGLEEFKTVFDVYLRNVEPLVGTQMVEALRGEYGTLCETAGQLREFYARLNPRLYRNRVVLERASRNFARSLEVMQNEADTSVRYNKHGKTSGLLTDPKATSSLRVRA